MTIRGCLGSRIRFRGRPPGSPATAETFYRVGSVSKLFTDIAVMQLVEQERLDLDAPVARILPEFAPRTLSRSRSHFVN